MIDNRGLEVGDCVCVNGRDYCMVVEISDKIYVDIIDAKKRTFIMPSDHVEMVEWWQFNAVES